MAFCCRRFPGKPYIFKDDMHWHTADKFSRVLTRCSAIAERPHCRVGYSFGQKFKTGIRRIFYEHYSSIFNHCDITDLKIYRIRWKNVKEGLLRLSKSFKVIEVGTNRKPICNFLLVINSNWHPIWFRSGCYCSLLFKFWTLCVFEHPFGGLRDNVRCSSWAHWKARSGLRISVN